MTLPAFPRWAFLKRATAFDNLVGTRCRTTVPAIPSSTRLTQRAVVFAPSWAPRASPLVSSTPPWTFGQGWNPASEWRYDTELIHHKASRLDLAADVRRP